MTAPTSKSNDGFDFPQIGLGTWPMDDAELAKVIPQAVELGYRLFDSAVNYGNEVGVGDGVRNSDIAREELFVTTKVPGRDHGYESTIASLEGSLQRMKLDYVDLYLIHWPNPSKNDYVDTWQAMVELQQRGLAKSIGVSNFKPAHLDRIFEESGVMPSINQIQLYPGVNQVEQREVNEKYGIITESWSPLGLGANAAFYGGHRELFETDAVTSAAEAHDKTVGQVILRWHVQLGLVPLPKSSNPQRLADNIDIFNWSLTDAEMDALSALDDGSATVADSDEHEEN